MKVKISFELDLAGTHYNMRNEKCIPECLQNLGSLVNELHLRQLEESLRILDDYKDDKVMRKALMSHNEQDKKLTSQLFHNYAVEGVLENGKKFTFTHTEPGYKENLTIE